MSDGTPTGSSPANFGLNDRVALIIGGAGGIGLAPGVIETPLLDQLPPEAMRLMFSKVPVGR